MVLVGAVLVSAAYAAPHQQPSAIAGYMGAWQATTYNRAMDTVSVTWLWVQRGDSNGTLRFGDETGEGPTKVVFASPDSLVFDLLKPLVFPAGHPLDGARQRYVARIRGDSLFGTVWTTVADGRRGQRPFRGSRVKK